MAKKTSVPIPAYNWGQTRQSFKVEGPSMTKQSMAKDCDVNEIVKRFDRTGLITHLQQSEGVFADVSELGSYQDAIMTVREAQESFLSLPSGLRSHFGNDPASYVQWAASATAEERTELYNSITGRDRTAAPTITPKEGADVSSATEPESSSG